MIFFTHVTFNLSPYVLFQYVFVGKNNESSKIYSNLSIIWIFLYLVPMHFNRKSLLNWDPPKKWIANKWFWAYKIQWKNYIDNDGGVDEDGDNINRN